MKKDNNRKFALAEIIIVVVIVILVAIMTTPAFKKVRETSQKQAIATNLRLLAAGANEYFEEHGVTIVHQNKLVGPGKYIEALVPVDGEIYPRILIQGTTLRVNTSSKLEVAVSL